MFSNTPAPASSFFDQNLIQISVGVVAIALLIVGLVFAGQTYKTYQASRLLSDHIAVADSLLAVAADQARERGFGALLLAKPTDAWATRQLTAVRSSNDRHWLQMFDHIDRVIATLSDNEALVYLRQRLKDEYDGVHDQRRLLDRFLADETASAPSFRDWMAATNTLNRTAFRIYEEIALKNPLPAEVANLGPVIMRLVWVASEHMGQNRAILAHYAAKKTPVAEEFLLDKLRLNRAMAGTAVNELMQMRNLPNLDTGLAGALEEMAGVFSSHCLQAEDRMHAAAGHGDYPQTGRQWLETATECIDSTLNVSLAASRSVQNNVKSWNEAKQLLLLAYIVFAVIAGLLALFSLNRVHRNSRECFRQKELAEVTLGSIGDAVITTNTEGNIEYINPAAQQLTGWSAEDARGRSIREVFQLYNHLHASMFDPVGTCLAEGGIVGSTGGHMLIRQDGTEIPIEDSVAPIFDKDGIIVGVVVVFYDTRIESHDYHLMSYQATRDALTGLVNRREFHSRLEGILVRARENGEEHALAYIDLDQFKVVNDSCGHSAGDRMLKQVAFLMNKRIRDADTFARLGGDEFGLLMCNCTMKQALRVAEELRRTVNDYRFTVDERVFQTSLSIGLVPINSSSVSSTELLSEADAACYAAKEKGRNRVQIYHPDDLELAHRQGEMQWVARINEALEGNLFILYCQPICPMKQKLPVHVEILIRMRQADDEIIPPMAFIPAAERYNLMPAIDRWVIRQTCTMIASKSNPLADTVYTVNLSGSSLCDEHLAEYIRQQAAEFNISSKRLCFEITETAAIANLDTAIELMQALREDGFTFALDDFGSGLSSLIYLKNLPVQLLKIDGAFVRKMLDDPLDLAMVQSFVFIANAVNIPTCAEFVENESILEKLSELNLDYAQGYAVAMPMPFRDYLERSGLNPSAN